MGELRNKCVENHPEWWTNVTVSIQFIYVLMLVIKEKNSFSLSFNRPKIGMTG
jgi:hypothetical protein